MSPFALLLRQLRQRRGLKQKDVADRLGYEQSYLSALERSVKGPPRQDFLTRLVRDLELSESEKNELDDALQRSRRQFALPAAASLQEYELIHALEPQLGQLSAEQITLIQIALSPSLSSCQMAADRRCLGSKPPKISTGTQNQNQKENRMP
tara:strand:+ start:1876 stop:2331 length:456 start_codon:yes stop_codon:yes gene_type:complete